MNEFAEVLLSIKKFSSAILEVKKTTEIKTNKNKKRFV